MIENMSNNNIYFCSYYDCFFENSDIIIYEVIAVHKIPSHR